MPSTPRAFTAPTSQLPTATQLGRSQDVLGPLGRSRDALAGVMHSRSLLSLEKALRELTVHVSRTMPSQDLSDRSSLTGVRVMLKATRAVEAHALTVLRSWREHEGGGRNAVRDQLIRARREAHAAAAKLEAHDNTLDELCRELQAHHKSVLELHATFVFAAAADHVQSLTATNSARPRNGGGRRGLNGGTSPRSPRGDAGGPSRPWSSEEDAVLLAQARHPRERGREREPVPRPDMCCLLCPGAQGWLRVERGSGGAASDGRRQAGASGGAQWRAVQGAMGGNRGGCGPQARVPTPIATATTTAAAAATTRAIPRQGARAAARH